MSGVRNEINRTPENVEQASVHFLIYKTAEVFIHQVGVLALQIAVASITEIPEILSNRFADSGYFPEFLQYNVFVVLQILYQFIPFQK